VIRRRQFLAALAGGGLACSRRRPEGFPGYVFVANFGGRAVAVVDLSAFAVTKHIRLNGAPSLVLAHPVKPVVYALTPDTGTIHEISTEDLTLHRRGRCRAAATSMRLSPSGEHLWILCRESRELIRLPVRDLEPDERVRLPHAPFAFDISPDGRQAAISFGDAGIVGLIALEGTPKIRRTLLDASCDTLRFRKDGKYIVVANPRERRLSILEAQGGRPVVRLPVPIVPEYFCFKRDGGELFVTGAGMDAVVTVYPYQTEIGSTTLAGRAPGYLAVSTGPEYLFVANPLSGDMTVLDVETQRMMAVVSVGKQPCYITITPDNQYALVLNRGSGTMAVVWIASLSGRRRKFAPLFTMIPVGSEPVNAVVRTL
jgi:YVTN family beta-propeller protein